MNALEHFQIREAGTSLAAVVFAESTDAELGTHSQRVTAVNRWLPEWTRTVADIYQPARVRWLPSLFRRPWLELVAVRAIAELEPLEQCGIAAQE